MCELLIKDILSTKFVFFIVKVIFKMYKSHEVYNIWTWSNPLFITTITKTPHATPKNLHSSWFCGLCEFYEAPALCSVLFESKITVPLYLKYSTRCEHIITQSWRVKNNGALRTSTNALTISIPGRNTFFFKKYF